MDRDGANLSILIARHSFPERLAFEATVKLPTAEEKATLGLVGYLADA